LKYGSVLSIAVKYQRVNGLKSAKTFRVRAKFAVDTYFRVDRGL